MTLTTPASALRPYSVDCGPRSTSTRSTPCRLWSKPWAMSVGTPSTSSSVDDENETKLAVSPRITGGCVADCPNAWNVKPGTWAASASRPWMPDDSSAAPSNTEMLAGSASRLSACLFTVTVTSGSTGCARAPPHSAKAAARGARGQR
jgi:hypothetical protein